MLFHSYMFVFIFLPVSLAGYHFMAGKGKGDAAKLWLAAVSLWFYGSFRAVYVLLLLGSVAFNYSIYLWMEKRRGGNGAGFSRPECDRESVGKIAGRAEGESARKPVGGSARKFAEETAGKPVGESARKFAEETARKLVGEFVGKITGKPAGAGKSARKPAGKFAGKNALARCRALLALGVIGNLALLAYFKYMNFFLENLYRLGGKEFHVLEILLPAGISFFTFQQISFLADEYRGEIGNCGFMDYLLYIVYFPKLLEGPLVNHGELLPQFAVIGRKHFDGERFIQGIALFVMGLLKKVMLADTFGGAVDYGYSNLEAMHGSDAALLVIFYALQLYFDFSGYCDMARGVGWMFGIELPVNFNSPYKAGNIIDFWKRWHITLNRFFTQYVYIPLGGNRRGRLKMYRNLLVVFLLSGIWHGAGWSFILWGMLHGVLYVLTRMWQDRRGRKAELSGVAVAGLKEELPGREREAQDIAAWCRKAAGSICRLVSVAATFLYVSVAWVYFRAESVAQGNGLLVKVLRHDFARVNRNLAGYFNLDEFWYILKVIRLDRWEFGHYILMAAVTAGSLLLVFFGRNAAQLAERMKPKAWNAVLLAGLFLWCVLTFSNVSTFLYFNF